MSKAKTKMGRPPVDPAERRDKRLHVLTTEGERRELDRAAKTAGLDVSSWVRTVALERARQSGPASAEAPKRRRRTT